MKISLPLPHLQLSSRISPLYRSFLNGYYRCQKPIIKNLVHSLSLKTKKISIKHFPLRFAFIHKYVETEEISVNLSTGLI